MALNTKTLFGLSIGDRVQYIANIIEDYSESIHNAQGTVVDINYTTAEFYVRLDGHDINYCFLRYELLRIGEKLDREPFEGLLLTTDKMSIGMMRNYLIDYHSFVEGRDFSITEKLDIKEVFLSTEKYSRLIQDITTLQEVSEKFAEEKIHRKLKYSLRSEILHGKCLTLFFKEAGWTFRTQIGYSLMYESVLEYYGAGVDLKSARKL